MKSRSSEKFCEGSRRRSIRASRAKWLMVTGIATFGLSAQASAANADRTQCGSRGLQNSASSTLNWNYTQALLPILKTTLTPARSVPPVAAPSAVGAPQEMTLDDIRGFNQGVAPDDLMLANGPILPAPDGQRRPWQEGMYMENGTYLPGSSLDPKNGPAPNPEFQVSANFWSSPWFTPPAPQVWMNSDTGSSFQML